MTKNKNTKNTLPTTVNNTTLTEDDFISAAEMILTDEPLDDYHKLLAARSLCEASGANPDAVFPQINNDMRDQYTSASNILSDDYSSENDDTDIRDTTIRAVRGDEIIEDDELMVPDEPITAIHGTDINTGIMNYQSAITVLNQYAFLGIPCAILGNKACGFFVDTCHVTFEDLRKLYESDSIDFLMYTDGNRATIIKQAVFDNFTGMIAKL